jgi:hypothetical protein
MSFVDGTRTYEAWLGGIIQLNAKELDNEAREMKKDRSSLLRASFTLGHRYGGKTRMGSVMGDAPKCSA